MTNKIAIFASGSGTNFQKITEYFQGSEKIEVSLLLTNKPDAGVIHRAERLGIPIVTFNRAEFASKEYLPGVLQKQGIDWIVLAGFLWKIPEHLIQDFPNRIINIHPALLPHYGGKGMYGHHVHEAVIAAEEKESGITIHYINEHYDKGAIIAQKKCVITAEDTPASLAEKIHVLEHTWFPKIIEEVIDKATRGEEL